MRRRDTVVCERARDLGEAAAARVLKPDALDDLPRKGWRPTGGAARWAAAGGLAVLVQQAHELGTGDESLAPGELDGLDRRHDVAVDRRDAHPERFGSLAARIGESLDLQSLSEFRPGKGGLRQCDVAVVVRARLARSGTVSRFERAPREEPLKRELRKRGALVHAADRRRTRLATGPVVPSLLLLAPSLPTQGHGGLQ